MSMSDKLTEQVNVKCSENDLHFINEVIQAEGGERSAGHVYRMALKYFRIDYELLGPLGVMMKLIDKV